MRVVELAARARAVDPHASWRGTDVEVTEVVDDSRQAGPGACFAALVGQRHDGHDHVGEAVRRGAVAVLAERDVGVEVPVVVVESTRAAVGPVAAAVHGDPSRSLELVGITGTNGKTTTAHLLAGALAAGGRAVEVMGTLTGVRTTPEAAELQRRLRSCVDAGIDSVAAEVSSHALDLRRVDGCRFAVGAFTNLTPEHLDHHKTMEAYEAAKARLLTAELTDLAVVFVDTPAGVRMAERAEVEVVSVRRAEASDVVVDRRGTSFTWRGRPVRLGLIGQHNVDNALVAAAIADALGADPDAICAGLSAAGPVPGRVEVIDGAQPFAVIVDFAHTPDALARLLAEVRPLAGPSGRVLVVMGCGGDRDRAKRPAMGQAAQAGAEVVIVTSDNPRGEDPSAIIDDILTGLAPTVRGTEPMVVVDRRQAIAAAVAEASPDDVVVIAGKGHETTQESDGVAHPFDDRVEARRALRTRFGAAR